MKIYNIIITKIVDMYPFSTNNSIFERISDNAINRLFVVPYSLSNNGIMNVIYANGKITTVIMYIITMLNIKVSRLS